MTCIILLIRKKCHHFLYIGSTRQLYIYRFISKEIVFDISCKLQVLSYDLWLLSYYLYGYALLFCEAVLTSTHNLCFEQKYEKYQNFYLKTFTIGGEIFNIFE